MLSSFPSFTTSLASTTTHKEEGQRSDEGKDKTQPLPLETIHRSPSKIPKEIKDAVTI